MCVIIMKPAGKALPSNKTLFRCYATNPHGMGFATPTSIFHSMDYRDFFEAMRSIPVEDPCILHFRWATHGSKRIENCHPFAKGDVKFAHNGVLPIPSKNDMTDSEIAFNEIIYPAIVEHGFNSSRANEIIKQTAGCSRFAIMQGREVKLYGDWHVLNGIYYSNLNWLRFM